MMVFVRAQADTDSADAPDTTLTVYARAAYQHIQALVWPWPQNKVTGDLTSVASQAEYAFTSLSVPTFEYVTSVTRGDTILEYVSPEQYRRILASDPSASADSTLYTVDGTSIRLWPTPSVAGLVYVVTGFRDFVVWPSGSSEPDLPRGFDEPICWYMLSKYYMSQEDIQLSQNYLGMFEMAVSRQIEAALRGSAMSAGPMIFGNQSHNRTGGMSYSRFVRKNVES